LIFVAAVGIMYAAVERLIKPRPLGQLELGLAVSLAAALVNLVVARILLAAGKKHRSIILEADAQHLMTDVWTSVGVVFGLGLVWLSGWEWLDPVVAIGVALNITRTAYQLMRRSVAGLMDAAGCSPDRAPSHGWAHRPPGTLTRRTVIALVNRRSLRTR
jgi:cation diffusion facilitator family transporter